MGLLARRCGTTTTRFPAKTPPLIHALLALCWEVSVSGRQIHDANIVATMLAYGERRLLTFNTEDFRPYENHIQLLTA